MTKSEKGLKRLSAIKVRVYPVQNDNKSAQPQPAVDPRINRARADGVRAQLRELSVVFERAIGNL
jgi:hypothetical protein